MINKQTIEDIKFSTDEIEYLKIGIAAQNDELERYKAFADEILHFHFTELQAWERLSIAQKHGITINTIPRVVVACA